MSNYIVTGAAGFIGSRVAEMLLNAGHGVIGWDNLNDAYDVRVKHWRLNRLTGRPGFEFRVLDIGERADVEAAPLLIDDQPVTVDGVINLAARAGVRAAVSDPWVYVQSNMMGTLNMMELCRRQGIGKFILASTSSIYGADPEFPTPETASSDYPLQPYAASKKGAEALAHSYHFLHNLDVTIFRFFTVYGPAGRPDMSMFRFCQWIAEGRPLRLNGDGEQTRGFTYIDDIARGVIQGLKPLGYEVINLGGHEVISMNGLINMLEQMIGRKAQVVHNQPHPADALANCANVEKAGRILGWEPQVTLQEGVKQMVGWYLAERSWLADVETG